MANGSYGYGGGNGSMPTSTMGGSAPRPTMNVPRNNPTPRRSSVGRGVSGGHSNAVTVHPGSGVVRSGTRGFMRKPGLANQIGAFGGRASNSVMSFNSQKIVKTTGVYGATFKIKHFNSGR